VLDKYATGIILKNHNDRHVEVKAVDISLNHEKGDVLPYWGLCSHSHSYW